MNAGKLRHIEGKTFRYCGYYIEEHADGMFYCYMPAAGYGSMKVWAHMSRNIENAIAVIEAHIDAEAASVRAAMLSGL